MSRDADPLTGPIETTDPQSAESELFGSSDSEDFEFAFDATTTAPPAGASVFVDDPPAEAAPQLDPVAPVMPTQPTGPTRAVAPQDLSRWERRRRVRLQARRVRRIVRHIEPWSVLKISIIFYACLWVILMVAGVLLWSLAVSSGTVDNVESFIRDLFALEEFELNPDQIFRGFAFGGLVLVIAGTAFSVLLCVLFNLISDLTGGLRITVIEEESARFRPRRRRGGPRRPAPPIPGVAPGAPPGHGEPGPPRQSGRARRSAR